MVMGLQKSPALPILEDVLSSSSSSIFKSIKMILLMNTHKSHISTDILSFQDVSKPDVKIRKGEDKDINQMHQ
ncbi:hypothetical protein IEQ34_006841 [Dendrobium chrysotoxum]|uniref:Uncharacterized protein n=1 Tax=Dendrobium chrysotoxum TaxID=161865 RepID=A0AAV7GQE0_DENCH|nr:hypothetical protein IEQ34_006841 [Dendrobium chrysotoxum]